MTPTTLSLRCPSCKARIKAPSQLLGQWRNCPGCGTRLLVRVVSPPDAAPLLVSDEAASGTLLSLHASRNSAGGEARPA